MNHINDYKAFESFSIKNVLGQKMVYCHDCHHSFNTPKNNGRNVMCPSCGLKGFILLDQPQPTLKPISRKI